ncbi:MAG TPA: ABC transporter ATP-binding protein [Patescibacteria group bacterium]|nr:ABC transporter ATP-binding protein [Patescibacteria group bacterium]
MLVVKDVTKQFKQGDDTVTALNKLSFTVNDGEFVSIVGKSGAGKSTLLGVLGALDTPTSGSIEIGDTDIAKLSDHKLISYRNTSIGFVFQSYNLIPNLTAVENVMLPMEFAHVPPKERRDRAVQLLEEVGIVDGREQRKPGKLSGGEQQRVSIARALANQPRLILADEPTGNLDSENGKMIFDLLHKLSRSENTTVVVVTHDLDIAGKTDRTFTLSDGKLIGKK